MSLSKNELFKVLLKQLELNNLENNENFSNAEIENLTVHSKSGAWNFSFIFDEILPFNDFLLFVDRLNNTFEKIAQINFEISTRNNSDYVNSSLINQYWNWVIEHSSINEQFIRQICNDKELQINNNVVNILLPNQAIVDFLNSKVLNELSSIYKDLGFPKLTLNPILDDKKAAESLANFNQRQSDNESDIQTKAKAVLNSQKEQLEEITKDNYSRKELIDSNAEITLMKDINEPDNNITVEGYVFSKDLRELRSKSKLLTLKITDYTSSFIVKKFINSNELSRLEQISEHSWVKVAGRVEEDHYLHDLVINANKINTIKGYSRSDNADKKRIEFHLHTQMSTMDATNNINDFVKQAKKWGHEAIAVTDHDNVQGFPDAFHAAEKENLKMIYGVEVNLVDDGEPLGFNDQHIKLEDQTYVIFDLETTGLSAVYDRVIELSAVKMKDGNVIDKFQEFINPGFPLSEQTINLTSITDEMLSDAKPEKDIFQMFREWYGDAILVGHNVTFDVGFMNVGYKRYGLETITNPIIDTLTLARFLYPNLKSYRLNVLSKKFGISLEHHHRAIYDAESTGHLAMALLKEAKANYNIEFHDQLNNHMYEHKAYKHVRPSHAILLAQTSKGLKNLFKLISLSNIDYFYRVPRIPKSELKKYRDGILVGTACSSGEVFETLLQKGYDLAKKKAEFYDYIEVQPKEVYQPLINSKLIKDENQVEELIKKLIQIAQEQNKLFIATGDVHYLEPHDNIYRKILVSSLSGMNRANNLPEVYFRTTDEMLDSFSFLGDSLAKKVVVDNTNELANLIEEIHPLKDKLYTPKMDGAEDEIRIRTNETAHKLYGEQLPDLVQKRIDRELKSIIGNGFSVIYLIAQRLVHKSNKDGYLVGSRGSVGSSLVATLIGITEVNPLPPHYLCPNCQYSEFYTHGEYGSGYDLPDKKCPNCGTSLKKDGQNIPFETFLGFKGNKVPDIDLNFSGDYQPVAHNYTKVLFGEDNVYRAGTIGTVANKMAYGYVKAYERDTGVSIKNVEIDRLSKGIAGVKHHTGQHPAGIIVVPDYMDIYDFTPIQYPAENQNASWKTTHFDFHSIHDNILKIDILGHDDPTMIRMLQDLSGIDPRTIPTDDPGVMKLFSGTEVLGVTEDQIYSKTGTLGIPEFGTSFVRGMLEETHPHNYSELLQISGLSHGTDVWLDNAESLIKDGTATIANVIGCRDNIMTDLINYGLDSEMSFQIMEHVRKGKGIPDEWQSEMRKVGVPEWYIDSCLKIKYMFPRAHASAYVLMALRIAYFKVYFPLVYYSAYFSVRADDFDIVSMVNGKNTTKGAIETIKKKGHDASVKDKNLLTVLEIANEMLERGYKFKMIDLDKSDAEQWLIDEDSLIAPFNSVPGLGSNVAKQIVAARAEKPFLSKEDLSKRGKVSSSVIEFLNENHVLDSLPDENQLSLF